MRGVSSNEVEELLEYVGKRPYILGRVEAKRIEPQYDRDMSEYSIYGYVPSSNKSIEFEKARLAALFFEINETAQKSEQYAMRYDIWFSKLE